MSEKSSKNLQANVKSPICGGLVDEGDCIYLDAGSTIVEMIPFLPDNIVVVTNGLNTCK